MQKNAASTIPRAIYDQRPDAERDAGEGLDKIMNVELVDPAALVAAPTGPNAGGRDETPWRRPSSWPGPSGGGRTRPSLKLATGAAGSCSCSRNCRGRADRNPAGYVPSTSSMFQRHY